MTESLWKMWKRVWWFPLSLALLGFASMAASCLPALQIRMWDEELGREIECFDLALGIGGWTALLFGILFCPLLRLSEDGRWK